MEPFVKCINVTQVSTRHNNPIRHFPIKLLQNLNSSSLLPFKPQTIQRICQIYWQLSSNLPNQLHTPIKISINAQNKRAIRDRLHELCNGDPKLFAETLSPKKIRVSLKSTNNIIIIDLRKDPFFFTPYSRAIGPSSLTHARVKECAPVFAVVAFEGINVVTDIEEAAGLRAVDDLVKRVGLRGVRVGVERDILGGEEVVVGVVTASLVANVFVGGAAVFDGEVGRRLERGIDSEVGGFGKRKNEMFGFWGERVW
ncbi:hypothetical protein Lal_00046219 [Lupinus albus]|nr:hypothetical protein Lal_00046219 [Lupinus albus]